MSLEKEDWLPNGKLNFLQGHLRYFFLLHFLIYKHLLKCHFYLGLLTEISQSSIMEFTADFSLFYLFCVKESAFTIYFYSFLAFMYLTLQNFTDFPSWSLTGLLTSFAPLDRVHNLGTFAPSETSIFLVVFNYFFIFRYSKVSVNSLSVHKINRIDCWNQEVTGKELIGMMWFQNHKMILFKSIYFKLILLYFALVILNMLNSFWLKTFFILCISWCWKQTKVWGSSLIHINII